MTITPQATAPERLANIKPLKIGANDGFEGNRRSDAVVSRFLKALASSGTAINSIEAGAMAVACAIDGGFLRWVLTVEPNGKTKEGKAPLLTEVPEGAASVKIPALGAFKGGYECVKDGKILRSRDGKPATVAKVTPLTKKEEVAAKAANVSTDMALLLKHLASHNMGGGILAQARAQLKKEEAAQKKEEKAKEKPTEKAAKPEKGDSKPKAAKPPKPPKAPKPEAAKPQQTEEAKPE